MPRRRSLLVLGLAGVGGVPLRALAHHGWSGFDQDKPLYLDGAADKVLWRNPHAEVMLRVANDLKLPGDLASRPVPAQSTPVDAAKVLGAAKLPMRHDPVWTIELAPLTRMSAWNVPEIKPGQRLAVVGYAATGETGDPVLRAEYLFADGKAYGLRSSPA